MPLDTISIGDVVISLDQNQNDITLRVLHRAYELLEKGWCQRTYARFGSIPISVPLTSVFATRYCAKGAILVAALEMKILSAQDAEAALIRTIRTKNIADWNDHHTKEEVLEAFRTTIAAYRRNNSSLNCSRLETA